MNIALYQGKEINLQYFPRDRFQTLQEAGQRGDITCAVCGEPLHMYLGIQRHPHFTHIFKRDSFACEAAVHARTQEKQEELAAVHASSGHDGFRLPQGRSITAEPAPVTWKGMVSAKDIPAFQEKTDTPVYSVLDEEQFPLDAAQYEAVTTTEGPLLILAGAGSGKTRVLTARTAYMVQEAGIDPRAIMLVTFTTKAAGEMKERLRRFSSLSPAVLNLLVVGTFHSIFYKMLLHHSPERWAGTRLLKADWQIDRMLKEAGAEISIDEREFPYDQAAQQISYWKNTLTAPADVRPETPWEEKVLYLYEQYEQRKRERGLFDFDDMLHGCYELLRDNPDLLARYQRRFRYFLIDEFQDVNQVQYEIMKLLSQHTHNLCVVGDDDQSIYAFRGSDPSFILNFGDDYPGAKVVTLSQNYRSTHSIVTIANKVIRPNKNRHPKQMTAQFYTAFHPSFFFPYDEEEEATMIVTDLKERISAGADPSQFAILYRTHAASRAIFERLSQSQLPFTIESDAESFYSRRIVRSALAYMRLSLQPDDPQAIQDVMTALFLKQSVLQDLKTISIMQDCTLAAALGKLTALQSFQQTKLRRIVPLFQKLRGLPPLAALDMIEKEMGLGDFIKKRGNEGNALERGSDDLRDLKVVAKKFTDIPALLAHADDMIAANKTQKQLGKSLTNAVQLLTIHRSKGLEYEHVYLLGAVDGSLPHDFALDAYREGNSAPLEEERRLTYVAMTRAKQSLFISVPSMRRGRTAYPSRFIKFLL